MGIVKLLIFVAFIGLYAVADRPACAAAVSTIPATCDEDFYDVLSARAWLEGKREMEAAQKLILRPDSVLEYSCFNNRLNEINSASGSIFAASAGGVNAVVRSPMEAFLNSNFSHTLGGGATGGSPGGTCAAMYAIWDFLKCQDFDRADFRTFAEHAGSDRRTLPAVCSGAAARTSRWNAQIAAANPVPAAPPAAGGVEAVTTHLGALNPARCQQQRPVPTGLMVAPVAGGPLYEDAVCVAPGCYYQAGNLARCF